MSESKERDDGEAAGRGEERRHDHHLSLYLLIISDVILLLYDGHVVRIVPSLHKGFHHLKAKVIFNQGK